MSDFKQATKQQFLIELTEVLVGHDMTATDGDFVNDTLFRMFLKGKNRKKLKDDFYTDLIEKGFRVLIGKDWIIIS